MRMRNLKLGFASLAAVAVLAGCSSAAATSDGSTETAVHSASTGGSSDALTTMLAENQKSHYTETDSTYDEASVVDVTLSGSSATASGSGVTVDGSTVTITAGGTYRLTGSLEGQVVVNADSQDVKVILNGVDLTNSSGSPVVVTAADEVTLILADATANTISDASSYADTSTGTPSSAIDSASGLSIAGNGALTVTGNNNDAINSADGLVIAGGNIAVKAADDGIRGKDYVIVSGGTVTVDATGDGVKSDNETDADRGYVLIENGSLTVASGDDGIKGFNDVAIAGGDITVSKSVEAVEAQNIVVAGGETKLTSSDDGMNVSGDAPQGFTITGGSLTIDAEGDGMDSNAAGTISGGSVVIYGPTMGGNGSVDVEQGLTMTGGELWAVGSSGMAESPSQNSTQAFVFTNLNGTASGEVSIADSNGNVLATQSSSKQYSSVLYSGPGISAEGTYQILLNGQSAGTVAANQYATGMGSGPGSGQPGAGQPGGGRSGR